MATNRFAPYAMICLFTVAGLSGCIGTSTTSHWALEDTQIQQALDLGRTGQGVRVGVLDTGIDTTHYSLQHLIDGNDENGELKDFRDFIDPSNSGVAFAHDAHGHGTHVVGIMTSRGSSLTDKVLYGGVNPLGASPNIQVWMAKVCEEDQDSPDRKTTCPRAAIEDALDWMAGQNLDIVTMSLGGDHETPILFDDETPATAAVNGLINAGVVVVASAGNDGSAAGDVAWPATIEAVIAVAAIQEDGSVWSHSSRGTQTRCTNAVGGQCLNQATRQAPHEKPEIAAPGVDIWSAWSSGVYARASGTSQAAPHVAATIALLLESEQEFSSRNDVLALKQAIADTALRVPGQTVPHDDGAGYGVIQAADLIRTY